MTVYIHELRLNRRTLTIWASAIAGFMALCVFMYPQMSGQMEQVGDMFSSMGSFTAAFGMDRLDIGTLTGFFAIECGNILGVGGAMYAAIIAAGALSGEEKQRTAEFLLTHPVSRVCTALSKLMSVITLLIILDAVCLAASVLSILAIGEVIPAKELILLHAANLICQVCTALVCFTLSAFIRGNGTGAGLGMAMVFYFMNIISNISESARFLKYLTPFSAAESADVISSGLNAEYILPFAAVAVILCAAGIAYYNRKDIF